MTLDEQIEAAQDALANLLRQRNHSCTGVSANWCPIHGDCICREPEESKSDDDCPLHSAWSDHQ